MRYTCEERVKNYNTKKKDSWSPLISHNGTICGFWWFGHWSGIGRFKGKYFYGAYPRGFLDRVKLLFEDIFNDGKILHLFSGTLKGDGKKVITFDICPELEPDVVGNAEEVDMYFSKEFDLILADPPYDDNYKKYNTPKFSRKKVIHKCSKICKDGGYLCWLDTIVPQWTKKKDGWLYRGNIGIQQSTNHRARVLTILEKKD